MNWLRRHGDLLAFVIVLGLLALAAVTEWKERGR